MYLLDSDVLINHLRGANRLPEIFFEVGVNISVLTYGEIQVGLRRKHAQKQKELFIELLEVYQVNMIDVDHKVVQKFADLKYDLLNQGEFVGDIDTLIAATALVHNLSIYTANRKHFQKIPDVKFYP